MRVACNFVQPFFSRFLLGIKVEDKYYVFTHADSTRVQPVHRHQTRAYTQASHRARTAVVTCIHTRVRPVQKNGTKMRVQIQDFRHLYCLFAYSSTIFKLRLKICQSRPVRSNTKTHRNPVILLKHEKALPGERVPQQGSAGPHPVACIGDYPYKLTTQSALREPVPMPVPAGARSRGPVPDC